MPPPTSWPGCPLPDSYRAAVVRRAETDMFEGMESSEKDPRKSLHVEEVPLPELAPDEAYVAVMASSINFNTVWTSIFEPLPTFGFLDRLGQGGRLGEPATPSTTTWWARDASGVVLRTGSAVRNWKMGDKVTVHCNYVDDQDPSAHDDSMLAANQRIWGFETNFGGLADVAVVKANQLMPKPAHLSWEEAAINALCNSTSYRMLVSPNGARMTQGDKVLVWGASGGLGSLRRAARAQRRAARRSASSPRPRRWRCSTISASRRSSTGGRPTTGSGRTSTPRTSRSGAVSARTSAAWWAASPTSCSSTRDARRWGLPSSPASAAGSS